MFGYINGTNIATQLIAFGVASFALENVKQRHETAAQKQPPTYTDAFSLMNAPAPGYSAKVRTLALMPSLVALRETLTSALASY